MSCNIIHKTALFLEFVYNYKMNNSNQGAVSLIFDFQIKFLYMYVKHIFFISFYVQYII
jgi:hypothetical protein